MSRAFVFALGTLILSVATTLPAWASYTLTSFPNVKLDPNKRIHIIVSGKGNDLGSLPLLATLAKAKKIREVYPDEQVLVINTREVSEAEQNSMITGSGLQILKSESNLLDSLTLIKEMVVYHKIASFNFFGHAGIEPGMFLDGVGENDLKWRPYSTVSSKLKGHFTSDAYVILNGCNQGHVQAPILSKLWGIPVAGTLTSSHFERQFSDGAFYWSDDQLKNQFAPHSLDTLRMRPDDVVYQGYYGKYDAGLAFYKFFCVGVSDASCLSAMKTSVYTIVGPIRLNAQSSQDDYLKVVREWLCPTQAFGSKVQEECMTRLAAMNEKNSDRSYSPLRGAALNCDFNSCYVKTCFSSAVAMTDCAKSPKPETKNSTSFVDEYLMYQKAFALSSAPTK